MAYESGCPSWGANFLGDPSEDVGGPGYRDNGGKEGGKEGRAVCNISLGHVPPCCLEEADQESVLLHLVCERIVVVGCEGKLNDVDNDALL